MFAAYLFLDCLCLLLVANYLHVILPNLLLLLIILNHFFDYCFYFFIYLNSFCIICMKGSITTGLSSSFGGYIWIY